ncbi:MAG: hypothetical protein EON54_27845 [Alcaligenaceae bacterium]|nr:MAG: hypothetical protein EON54_27845 [Alcaligenaceae bacterium]
MDFVHIVIAARSAHGDLVSADRALEAGPDDAGVRLILVKQLLVSCANVTDLELICRSLYKDNPGLSEVITPHRRNFEFAKYIRNIAVGHVNPALSQKAIEWRPELNALLTKVGTETDAFLGYAVLEAAINTFVDRERHRIFDSDTDLAYPPDLTRFLNFLGSTVHVGIAYCAAVADAALKHANLPDYDENWWELSMKAGATDFAFITRKG